MAELVYCALWILGQALKAVPGFAAFLIARWAFSLDRTSVVPAGLGVYALGTAAAVLLLAGLTVTALTWLRIKAFARWLPSALVAAASLLTICLLGLVATTQSLEEMAAVFAAALALSFAVGSMLAARAPSLLADQGTAPHGQDSGRGEAAESQFQSAVPLKTLASIAGMTEFKASLTEKLRPFKQYKRKGSQVSDSNGILLSGPPGVGKTMVAEAIAGELGFRFFKVTVSDLTSKWVNESAQRIGELRDAAIKAAPCVVFLDEVDAVAGNRSRSGSHGEDKKVVNALLTMVDALRKEKVLLVAATNFLDDLDPAFVRDGRFDTRVDIPYPDLEARRAILADLVKRHNFGADPKAILKIATSWERRSPAFIEGVVKRVRDALQAERRQEAVFEDFKRADRDASKRQGAIPANGASLSELVLPAPLKDAAVSLVNRLRNWEGVIEQGGTPPSGVLLVGPPGTGKTNLVRAITRELGDYHLFQVDAAEILDSPKKFDEIVELASQHRPAIVFIDEADDLLRDRSISRNPTATNAVLKAMDGFTARVPEVVFMAATNAPDAIDAAAKRGGRFAEKLYVGPLEGPDLVALVEHELSKRTSIALDAGLDASAIAILLGGKEVVANVLSILNQAVNLSLSRGQKSPLTAMDVEIARDSLHAF